MTKEIAPHLNRNQNGSLTIPAYCFNHYYYKTDPVDERFEWLIFARFCKRTVWLPIT
jgi:hypothetical protein